MPLAKHRQIPSTAQLKNSEFLDQIQESRNFAFITRQFRYEVGMLNANDLSAKQLTDLDQFRTIIRTYLDFHENQLARNRLAFLEIMNLDNVDQLFQLLGYLIQNRVIATYHSCDARDLGIMSWRHIERVDIESPTAKQAGNAREDAKFIFY